MNNQGPALPNRIGKTGKLTSIHGKRISFKIVDEIIHRQSDTKRKVFYLQKLEFENGKVELRLGYYILGEKPGMKNRWVWGQYTPQMPSIDFKEIINKAKKKSFI